MRCCVLLVARAHRRQLVVHGGRDAIALALGGADARDGLVHFLAVLERNGGGFWCVRLRNAGQQPGALFEEF